MKDYLSLLDPARIPAHVAVIMDGNGRWAGKKSRSRLEGHRRGAETVEPVVEAAAQIGISCISLFAFSTENWNRPASEVNGLWKLLELFFESRIGSLMEKGVRVVFSGSFERLPSGARSTIAETVRRTRNNKKITLNFCINYGGRQEIVDGVNGWLEKEKGGGAAHGEETGRPSCIIPDFRGRPDDPYQRRVQDQQLHALAACLLRSLYS